MKRIAKFTVSILLTLFLCLGLLAPNVYAENSTHRISGETRYDTAAEIAKEGWPDGSEWAIIASGQNYPDALSAAPLAKKYDAPILLTNGSSLPNTTRQTLTTLRAKNVFIIGGTGVVPASIDAELNAMNITATRIAGQDRYDTAIKVAKQLGSPSEVFIVTGEDYPDALSVGPVAAIKQEPIILVPQNYIPSSVKTYIEANKITKSYVIGDTDIINDNVVNQFPGAERVKGVDKYVRNININIKFDYEKLFTSKDICVASGEGFADALTGVAYATKKSMPIVLVTESPSSITRLYTVVKINMVDSDNGIPYIFGGTSVVSDNAVSYLYSLPDTGQSSKPSVPNNLVAKAISSSEITVQWDQVKDADYYNVYVSFDGNNFISLLNKDGSNEQYEWYSGYSYKLYGIDPDTTRYFKITAVKNSIESDFSNIASATTFSAAPITQGPLKLIADDSKHTYLGKLTTNKFDPESVFNEFGTYGSKYSLKSIYNEFGTFGGEFSLYSPFNEFSISPPLIVNATGNTIGRLSVNKYVSGAISPYIIFDVLANMGL